MYFFNQFQNDHNPDVTSKSAFTPLHIASHYGNEAVANLLIQKGADVNYSAKHNITPLHVAAKWGKLNMVQLLIEKGANIESKTRDGLTPLHCAARSGHEQVVDMLLERGAPISSKTKVKHLNNVLEFSNRELQKSMSILISYASWKLYGNFRQIEKKHYIQTQNRNSQENFGFINLMLRSYADWDLLKPCIKHIYNTWVRS